MFSALGGSTAPLTGAGLRRTQRSASVQSTVPIYRSLPAADEDACIRLHSGSTERDTEIPRGAGVPLLPPLLLRCCHRSASRKAELLAAAAPRAPRGAGAAGGFAGGFGWTQRHTHNTQHVAHNTRRLTRAVCARRSALRTAHSAGGPDGGQRRAGPWL